MSSQDYPTLFADQAVNILAKRDLVNNRYIRQSTEVAHRRWARITNLNWTGITNWSVNPMVGTWDAVRTRDGMRRVFNAEDGATVYRIVQVTPDDLAFGFHESQCGRDAQGELIPGDFYIVRGWTETVPKAHYTQECTYLKRPKAGFLNARPVFTFFRPDCYIGPYSVHEDAVDDASRWAIEDQGDANSYELATDPFTLNMNIDRAVGMMP
jgi:hypothetical protein